MTMTDCMVTSLSTGGSGGQDRLTENISINFAEFKVEYTPQKNDGKSHKLEVTVKGEGLVARARKSYVAPR